MFVNNFDSLLSEGENLNASNSSDQALSSALTLSDVHASSGSSHNALSSFDAASANIEQIMADIESSAIVIPKNAISVTFERDSITGDNSYQYNNHTYFLTEQAVTWEEAQAEAVRRGGNLVTINDAAEDRWLSDTFNRNENFWMGISDRNQEGVFAWASGEAVDYTNWAAGEPDDYAGTQDYGVINYGAANQWNDEHDYARFQGIIEVSTPAPSGGDFSGGGVSGGDSEAPQFLVSDEPESMTRNGSQYLLLDESLTWEEAQKRAEALGGNLVTVNDAAEEQWLQETFGKDESLWIGISDRNQEGTFEWASGEAVDYTNWAAGEPDDYAGTQDYGTLNYGDDKQWNDEHFYDQRRGIVEIQLNGEEPTILEPPITEPPVTEPPILPEVETPTVAAPITDNPVEEAPVEETATDNPVTDNPVTEVEVPQGYVTHNGSQYLLLEDYLTWDDAQAQAQWLGGNLVTINSAAEEQWLQETFGTDKYWIGINDKAQEGVFAWASGEAVTYTNWAPGEPYDWQGVQDVGVMNAGAGRQWDDDSIYGIFRGLVEIGLNTPILPAEDPTDVTVDVPVVVPPSAPLVDEETPVYSIYDDAFTRGVPDDYSGYNFNVVEVSDFNNTALVDDLVDGIKRVGAHSLRIPGGDTANYYDWDIGGVAQWTNEAGEARATWAYPYFLPEALPLALNWEYGTTGSVENLKPVFTESGASPLWVVNMNTSDLGKEMRHLQEALAAGLEIERIELGNELYFGIQNYVRPDFGGEAPQVGGTPTARDYAAKAKEWALAIRAIPGLEDATIAVTGVSPEHVPERRGVEWWPALLEKTGPDNRSAVDVVDAFTLHPYYSTNDLGVTKGDVGNWNRAGEIARKGISYLRDTLEDPALHHSELKDKEMWITEHNIIEDAVITLGGTWLQALMLDFHTQEFLKDPRVTSSYMHILTGNAQWQGLTDEEGLQIDGSQLGIADRPFTTNANETFEPTAMGLVISKTADVFDEGTATLLESDEAFIAWLVTTNSGKDLSAVNANSQSDSLVLPEGEVWEITTYTTNPWDTIYGEDELQVRTQTLNGGETLTIDAFTKVIAKAK